MVLSAKEKNKAGCYGMNACILPFKFIFWDLNFLFELVIKISIILYVSLAYFKYATTVPLFSPIILSTFSSNQLNSKRGKMIIIKYT